MKVLFKKRLGILIILFNYSIRLNNYMYFSDVVAGDDVSDRVDGRQPCDSGRRLQLCVQLCRREKSR